MPLLAMVLAVGPVDRPCPAGAAVARDAQTLDRLLADGPADVWVAGTVGGDHAAARGVRLHGCEHATLRGSGLGTVLKVEGDGAVVEDLAFVGSGARVSFEDGALKVSGRGAAVRRVSVRDCLYGIAMEKCPDCALDDSYVTGRPELEDNQRGDGIKLWEAHGSTVRRNRVESVRDVVVWYSRHVTLEDNVITGGRYGTHFMYAHDSVVRRSRLERNVVGIFVMYSARVLAEDNVLAGAHGSAGMGIGFKESDAVTLRRNQLVANTAGTYLDQTPRDPRQPVLFEENLFALNTVALRTHSSEHGATFRANDFVENDALAEVEGNGDARGVEFTHNHFSSYAGYDLDRDGTGDVAFQLSQPSSDLNDAHPNLKWFRGTAAMALYDAVAQALPFFGTRLLLEDPTPAVKAHREVPR
ncbi:MAG: right-handed parallel beta-helix repeat-containing protein [Archangiaceae bacterium]|nr:right-handed parallel beta-helix repeat-containing protein [Archangiaceae bacterium]